MPKFIDLTGHKYGRLTVIEHAENRHGRTAWLCSCECGNTFVAVGNDLRTGKTVSCGCVANENRAKNALRAGAARGKQLIKHGHSGERLYGIWKAMRQRCSNPNDKYFKDYGGRGINVCAEWNDYAAFRQWAYSNGYDDSASFGQCTLDRIDNNSGYRPDNCRWVPLKIQANNRRKEKTT